MDGLIIPRADLERMNREREDLIEVLRRARLYLESPLAAPLNAGDVLAEIDATLDATEGR